MLPDLKITFEQYPGIDIKPAVFLGDFSLDENRQFCNDSKRNLKFLKNYNWNKDNMVSLDLNKDYDGRIIKDIDKMQSANIKHILQWILSNKDSLYIEENNISRIFPDFVCFRGRLSQILNTPYSKNEPWIFDVVKYRGTIYLAEVETPKNKKDRLTQTDEQKRMMAWGFKFEQQFLGEDGPVNENPEYCCVFKTTIGRHSLLSVAEVDAADFDAYQKSKDDVRSFVEFKTNKLFSLPNAQRTFHRYKARKWWAQSAIIGIPNIICGCRTMDGIVTHTKNFNVADLPFYGLAKEGRKPFEPNVMLNFSRHFFDWLQTLVVRENPIVYRIYRNEYTNYIQHEMSPNPSFIKADYMKEMFPSELQKGVKLARSAVE